MSSKMNAGLYASSTPEWSTPQDLFDRLDAEFHFTLDACATVRNHKCERYFIEAEDGLSQPWGGHTVWVNPPYGSGIGDWVKKGYSESCVSGSLVVMLLPARTDTAWWHEYVMGAYELRLIRGRLKFEGAPSSAPFPSAVVVFKPGGEMGTGTGPYLSSMLNRVPTIEEEIMAEWEFLEPAIRYLEDK
jgi:phage N-6-adenine-methyltransferase